LRAHPGHFWRAVKQTGALQMITDCQGKGWQMKDDICYPYAAPDGLYGWRVPEARTPPAAANKIKVREKMERPHRRPVRPPHLGWWI
jgi:hypothetical protein